MMIARWKEIAREIRAQRVMLGGRHWFVNFHRLDVWNFGIVLTVDRVTACAIAEADFGPWTVRFGVNA